MKNWGLTDGASEQSDAQHPTVGNRATESRVTEGAVRIATSETQPGLR